MNVIIFIHARAINSVNKVNHINCKEIKTHDFIIRHLHYEKLSTQMIHKQKRLFNKNRKYYSERKGTKIVIEVEPAIIPYLSRKKKHSTQNPYSFLSF